MQQKFRILLALLPFAAASCSDAPEFGEQIGGENITVTIGSGPRIDMDIQSRTELGPDGETVKWAKGDTIALWAVDAGGTTRLSAHPFAMFHYNEEYNDAKFTGNIPQMPENTYTYYGVAPRPVSVNGLKASFDIPSAQDGTFNGAYDIMVARPVQGGALVQGDNTDKVNLSFSHKVHVLKITIPRNKMEMPISRLELTFPQPVTGRLTVDAANPDAAPEFSGSDNVLTLNFAQPVDAGSTVYAIIAPVAFNPAENIQFKAYTDSKESLPVYMPGKNFAEAHTTPIRLTIPEVYRVTHIVFSLDGDGTSTLGEKVNNLILTAPAGVDLGEGKNTRTFAVNADNQYYLSYEGIFNDNLSGKQFTVTFDSENTALSKSFTMPQLKAEQLNTVNAFSAPYLMFEDFTSLSATGTTDTGTKDLSGSGLPGWLVGNRAGYEAGKCVYLRHYSNIGGPFYGRMNSCKLSGIKAGKTVTINLEFNADWRKNKAGNVSINVGRSSGTGHDDAIEGGRTISMSNNGSASVDYIPTLHKMTVTGCNNGHRIAWKSGGANGSWFNYDNVYIDNVKISIAK